MQKTLTEEKHLKKNNSFTLPLARWFLFVPSGAISSAQLSQIAPLYRRRLSNLSRMAIIAASSCLNEKVPRLHTVFASRHGEIGSTVKMLHDLSRQTRLSPAAFSLSVHSTAAGFLSIARSDHSSFTTVSAGTETLFAAFQEAAGQLTKNPSLSLLVICADEMLPEELRKFGDSMDKDYALALYFNETAMQKELVFEGNIFAGKNNKSQPAIAFADFLESGNCVFHWNGTRNSWKITLNEKSH
jgi:3-oxoacyl-(acyl-carrier-protein) synthase